MDLPVPGQLGQHVSLQLEGGRSAHLESNKPDTLHGVADDQQIL